MVRASDGGVKNKAIKLTMKDETKPYEVLSSSMLFLDQSDKLYFALSFRPENTSFDDLKANININMMDFTSQTASGIKWQGKGINGAISHTKDFAYIFVAAAYNENNSPITSPWIPKLLITDSDLGYKANIALEYMDHPN